MNHVLVRYFGGFLRRPKLEETAHYMKGYCAYFALAVHEAKGYDLVEVGAGDHCAARTPDGQYVDIRGIMHETEFLNGFADTTIRETTPELVLEKLRKGVHSCGYYHEPDMDKARKIVKSLLNRHLR